MQCRKRVIRGPILNLSNSKVIGIHIGGNRDKECNLGLFLKYPINELNERNDKLCVLKKKYGIKVKDFQINELFIKKEIEDEDLNYLCDFFLVEKMEKLSFNSLNPINPTLIISVLERLNFKKLKELHLAKISDISIFEKIKEKINKLEKISMFYSKKNIDILENYTKELKELNLNLELINKKEDYSMTQNVKFDKLEKLYISSSTIPDTINILENIETKELKELYINVIYI